MADVCAALQPRVNNEVGLSWTDLWMLCIDNDWPSCPSFIRVVVQL
jgi:hypothetical protein